MCISKIIRPLFCCVLLIVMFACEAKVGFSVDSRESTPKKVFSAKIPEEYTTKYNRIPDLVLGASAYVSYIYIVVCTDGRTFLPDNV